MPVQAVIYFLQSKLLRTLQEAQVRRNEEGEEGSEDLTKQMADGTLPRSWLKMRSRLNTVMSPMFTAALSACQAAVCETAINVIHILLSFHIYNLQDSFLFG